MNRVSIDYHPYRPHPLKGVYRSAAAADPHETMMIPQGNDTVIVNDLKDPVYRAANGRVFVDKGQTGPPEHKVLIWALSGLAVAVLVFALWFYFLFIH
jgi:hypothetical protein